MLLMEELLNNVPGRGSQGASMTTLRTPQTSGLPPSRPLGLRVPAHRGAVRAPCSRLQPGWPLAAPGPRASPLLSALHLGTLAQQPRGYSLLMPSR